MREMYYDSCGKGQIYACCWEPEEEPRGIVQIIHGIAEHIGRYDDFARYLNSLGYLVVAEDHMGHGKTASSGIVGYFHGGWFAAVEDSYRLYKDIRKAHPHIPYFLFGHSMGSFLLRTIMIEHPECEARGCIICGTGWIPTPMLKTGIAACKTACAVKDETKASPFLQNLVFGSYNKKIEHPRTPFDWLSRDNAVVDAFIADPMCGFTATAGLLRDMMVGVSYIQREENLARMKASMPVFLIAGGDDPVGDYGKGVEKVKREFTCSCMENVASKIYPLCRHEILNEINRLEVYKDIAEWLKNHT